MQWKIICLTFLATICLALWLSPYAEAIGAGIDAECAECGLAMKINKLAMEKFDLDKKEGLKLFIKAHKHCPDNPLLNFNLGLAYYRYGNQRKAEDYIKKAVQKTRNNGDWLNLLAWLMLETSSDKAQALKYAQKAAKLKPSSPSVIDTFIRAQLENGQLYKAAVQADKAKRKWPKNEKIKACYGAAIDKYIAFYLKKTKAGQHDDALEGLRLLDFDAEVANAYCWALFTSGKTEDALNKARKAKEKFTGAESLKDTFDQIIDRFIQACYQEFKLGKRAQAIMSVDKMKALYASQQGLKEAYDKMMKVILEEEDTITIPEPIRIASKRIKLTGEGAGLLLELQGGGPIQSASDDDLEVDVDKNIPKGAKTRPEAVAVIIGNQHYSKFGRGIPDVDYAVRDAAYMKQYVINVLGYKEENFIYGHDMTLGDMGRIFGTKENSKGELYNWVKPGQSEVFIYYAGHGAPGPKGKGAFLMPIDADADYIAANGYLLDTLYSNLAKIPARRITVILDACFSGNSAKGMLVKNISPGLLKSAVPIKRLDNAVVFTSASKDQVSHWYPEKRHSLFTYFFLKGLKGEADSNKDKCITVAELKIYLNNTVPYRARRLTGREQTPLVVGDESWVIVNFNSGD